MGTKDLRQMGNIWLPPQRKIVGNEVTYPQSWRVAFAVMKELMKQISPSSRREFESALTPIVLMQLQQGKTSVIALVIFCFLNCMKRLGLTCQVNVVLAIPHTVLMVQTMNRLFSGRSDDGLKCTGYCLDMEALKLGVVQTEIRIRDEKTGKVDRNFGVMVHHRANYHQAFFPNVDFVLTIIDEIHQGNREFGVLDKTFRENGVLIGRRPYAWKRKNGSRHLVVGVSATAFAHAILSDVNGKDGADLDNRTLFKSITVEPSASYYGMKKLFIDGRGRQMESLFEKVIYSNDRLIGVPSEFATTHLLQEHRNGIWLVRGTGKKNEAFRSLIESKHPRIEYRAYDSDNQNIHDLRDFLSTKPDHLVIVGIRAAGRAGMTYDDTSGLLGVMETISAKDDSGVQGWYGRSLGYGKEKDRYPIFGKKAAAKAYIGFYDDLLSDSSVTKVPSGLKNEATELRRSKDVVVSVPRRSKPAKHGKVIGVITRDEWAKYVRSHPHNHSNGVDGRLATTKGFKRRDPAGGLLAGQPFVAKYTMAIYCNGPGIGWAGNGERKKYYDHTKSWNKLIAIHPEWNGMVVLVEEDLTYISPGKDRIESIHMDAAIVSNNVQ